MTMSELRVPDDAVPELQPHPIFAAAGAARSTLLQPVATVLFALAVGFLVVVATGADATAAYGDFLLGTFSSPVRFANMLGGATPLIIVAMSVIISFRAGIFNVGAEGQLYLGALVGAMVGFTFGGLPGPLLVLAVLLSAALVGALYAGVPAVLKASYGVDEVVTTIMLNSVAILFTDFMVNNVVHDPAIGAPSSYAIADQAQLPLLLDGSTATWGLWIAVVLVVVTWFLLFRTVWGANVRAVGTNPRFAETVGIRVSRTIVMAMLVGGAMAGIAGAVQVLGVTHRFYLGFSANYGLIGLTVALLGRLNPIGAVLAALLYATLLNGAAVMQLETDVPRPLVDMLAGLIVLLMTSKGSASLGRPRRPRRSARG